MRIVAFGVVVVAGCGEGDAEAARSPASETTSETQIEVEAARPSGSEPRGETARGDLACDRARRRADEALQQLVSVLGEHREEIITRLRQGRGSAPEQEMRVFSALGGARIHVARARHWLVDDVPDDGSESLEAMRAARIPSAAPERVRALSARARSLLARYQACVRSARPP